MRLLTFNNPPLSPKGWNTHPQQPLLSLQSFELPVVSTWHYLEYCLKGMASWGSTSQEVKAHIEKDIV